MPSRNVLKLDIPETFYHVYARGISRGRIYMNDEDYKYFLLLLARYLSIEPSKDRNGVTYPHLFGRVELVCYCLMPNHFHLLIYQQDAGAMKAFMQSLMTSYSRYFNKKYKRSGSLFESRYKASMVIQEKYLQHITRYIHMNPKYWKTFQYSSLQYYFSAEAPEFLVADRIEALFKGRQEYLAFLEEYIEQKKLVDSTKYALPEFY
jgi:putative transposase